MGRVEGKAPMQMRYRRRRVRAAALTLTVTLGLFGAACSADDSGGGSAQQFTYWSMWQEKEPQAKVLAKALADFEKESGIKVKVEWQGRDNVTKLLAALRTDDVPDLIDQQYFTVSNAIVKNDQFKDLSDVHDMEIPGESKTVRQVIPEKYDQFTTTANGAQFLIPYEVIGYSIWYDAKTLPDVADNPPKTWQEFADVLARSKASGRNPIALDGDIAGYAEFWTATALSRTLGPGGFYKLVSDKQASGWNNPGVRNALAAIASLAKQKYFIPGYDSSKFPAIQTKWAQNQADFLYMGSWAPTETGTLAAPGFKYRSFNFPTFGSDESLPASVIGFAVPKSADHAEAAQKFIAHFLHKERLSKISSEANNLTPRSDVEVPEQLEDVNELLQEKKLSKITDGVLGDFSDFDKKVFQPLNLQLMTGKITPDEFIDQITTGQRDFWAGHRS
ncbi:carbohydrate ABC transporter substrate-binding protein [Nonomuraea longispora]|uniref:Carbohydrate ABC transporter substrate-binding protein n=2 Tax=Nonomuraea longispora TaxID=1848320 RepID=A0A4R4NJM5_9ACTN|nr:carbohydrate ABC transporter substrate-binding protein [Nonomuraea longispora]